VLRLGQPHRKDYAAIGFFSKAIQSEASRPGVLVLLLADRDVGHIRSVVARMHKVSQVLHVTNQVHNLDDDIGRFQIPHLPSYLGHFDELSRIPKGWTTFVKPL